MSQQTAKASILFNIFQYFLGAAVEAHITRWPKSQPQNPQPYCRQEYSNRRRHRLQTEIRYGRNGSLYNAKVTKVLDDEFVMVCTQDEDPDIAETKFKIVRLTEEQAESGKPSGFTKGCANVGFAVAGAHDY